MGKLKKISMFLIVAVFIAATSFAAEYSGKKVLFIDSYHEGYAWSDGITNSVKAALDGTGVDLKIVRMDTKRNKDEDFKKDAALKVKGVIEQFKPDVVIAADDNASKYLIVPYYTGSDLPFVFCGLNWDSSIYGFPTKNVTGMVEVSPIPQLLDQLKPFAKGTRVGHIGADTTSSKKEGEYYKKIFNIDLVEYYGTDLADWKKGFLEVQGQVDMMIVGNKAGINDWDDADAAAFAKANTKIPTGATQEFIADYAMITFAKVAEEFGDWAAKTALQILDGSSPANIPEVKNEMGSLIINTKIAKTVGAEIPYEVLGTADRVIE